MWLKNKGSEGESTALALLCSTPAHPYQHSPTPTCPPPLASAFMLAPVHLTLSCSVLTGRLGFLSLCLSELLLYLWLMVCLLGKT